MAPPVIVTRIVCEEEVAAKALTLLSLTIREMVDTGNREIHLPEISYHTMSKIIEYCKKHVDAITSDDSSEDNLKDWDADFVKLDPTTLLDILLAANYLQIKGLVDLTRQALLNIMNHETLARRVEEEEELIKKGRTAKVKQYESGRGGGGKRKKSNN